MALNAGSAFLQIIPSFKGLVNAVKSEAVKAGREAGKSFNQGFEEETGRSTVPVPAPSDTDSRDQGTKSAGAFVEGFRARLAAASRSLPDLQINADSTDAERELAHLKTMILALRDAKIGVDLDEHEALARLNSLHAELDRLSRESPSIKVRADTAVAAGEIAKLQAALTLLDHEVVEPKIEPKIDESAADRDAGAFMTAFRARLAAAARSLPDLEIGADGSQAEEELALIKGLILQLGNAKIGIDLDEHEALARLAELQAELDRLAKESPSIRVRTDIAVASAELAKLQAVLTALDREVVEPKLAPKIDEAAADRDAGAFIETLRKRIEAASKSLPALEIGASTSKAEQQIKELQARLAALKGSIGVDLNDKQALAEINAIQGELERLSSKSPSIQVRVDTGRAAAELAALQAEVDHLNGQNPRITPVVDVTRALPQISALRLGLLALSPALIPIGAAGVAAFAGIAGGALAAAGGLGVAALAIKGTQTALENQSKAQQQSTKDAQTAAEAQKQAGKAGESAQQAVVQATRANQAAQENLFKALQSGKGVGDAYNRVQQTQADGARKVAAAQGGYQDALGKSNDAQKQAADSAKKLAEANAAVTPAMKSISDFISGTLKPELQKLQQTAANGFLPGAEEGLRSINTLFPQVNALIGAAAKAMGDLAAAAGKALQAPFWNQFLTFVTTSIGPAIRTLGTIIGGLTKGFAGIFEGLAPVMAQVGAGIAALTTKFGAFGEKVAAGNSEKFNAFLAFVQKNGPLVAKTLGDVVEAVGHIVTALAPLGPPLLKATDGFAKFVKALDPSTIRGIAVALLALAIPLKALFFVGDLVLKFQALGEAFSGVGAAAEGEGFLAMLGPIGLVAGAVIALTLLVVAFHDKIGPAFDAIGGAIRTAASTIAAPFKAAFSDVVLAVQTNVGLVKSAWSGITGFLGPIVSGALSGVKAAFSDVVLAVKTNVGLIKDAWSAVGSFLGTIVSAGIAGVKAAFNGVVAVVSGTVSGIRSAWSAVGSFLGSVISAGIAGVNAAFNGVVAVVSGVVSGVKATWDGLASVFGPVVQAGMAAARAAVSGVTGVVSGVVNGIKSSWGGLKGFFGPVISAGMSAARSAFQGVQSAASAAVSGIKSVWSGLKGFLGPVVSGALSGVRSAFDGVRSTVSSVVSGIKSVWSGLRSALTSPISSAVSSVKSAFNSVKSTVSGVISYIKSAFSSVVSAVKSPLNSIISGINHVIDGLNKFPGSHIGHIGFLARGGRAEALHPYVVGEVGPEMFFPGVTGTVVSNRQILEALAAAGSALPPGLAAAAAQQPRSGREWAAVAAAFASGRVGADAPGMGARPGASVAIGTLISGVNAYQLAAELDWKARGG